MMNVSKNKQFRKSTKTVRNAIERSSMKTKFDVEKLKSMTKSVPRQFECISSKTLGYR